MEAVAHSELAKLSLDLKVLNAKPLWERTTRMGPGSPAVPAIWRYRDMRPQLLRAVELITARKQNAESSCWRTLDCPVAATSLTRSIAGFR